MAICSYIVYPQPGSRDALRSKLTGIAGCDVMPAENNDVMILVTDTNSDSHETAVQQALKQIPEIQCLALTFGDI